MQLSLAEVWSLRLKHLVRCLPTSYSSILLDARPAERNVTPHLRQNRVLPSRLVASPRSHALAIRIISRAGSSRVILRRLSESCSTGHMGPLHCRRPGSARGISSNTRLLQPAGPTSAIPAAGARNGGNGARGAIIGASEDQAAKRPTRAQLRTLFVHSAVPMVGFGESAINAQC